MGRAVWLLEREYGDEWEGGVVVEAVYETRAEGEAVLGLLRERGEEEDYELRGMRLGGQPVFWWEAVATVHLVREWEWVWREGEAEACSGWWRLPFKGNGRVRILEGGVRARSRVSAEDCEERLRNGVTRYRARVEAGMRERRERERARGGVKVVVDAREDCTSLSGGVPGGRVLVFKHLPTPEVFRYEPGGPAREEG
jgi:hypothetical protein